MIFHVKRIKYSEMLFPQSWLVGGIGLSRFSLVGSAGPRMTATLSSVQSKNQETQVVMAAALSIFAIHWP